MALLKLTPPSDAADVVAGRFEFFKSAIGMVPKPFEMLGISPELQEAQMKSIEYYQNHPNLGFPVLTLIRYLVALEHDYKPCMDFNKHLLKMQGMTDEDIEALKADPGSAPVEDKDRALLKFVLKAVRDPRSITAEDMAAMAKEGWSERDIFDATFHGASMVGPSILIKAFQLND